MEEQDHSHRPKVTFSAEFTIDKPEAGDEEDLPQDRTPYFGRAETLMQSTLDLAIEVFNEIDSDHTRMLDFQKTLNWWHHNFAKINTHAMFDAVDQDRDGQISLDEWIAFWQTVRSHSHLDEEIVEELNNIRDGCSWVVFDDIPTASRD
jgi:hypothetical protein